MNTETEIASPSDIMSAINLKGANEDLFYGERPTQAINAEPTPEISNKAALINPLKVDNNYYLNKAGFAIQIAAFSDLKLPQNLFS